MASMEERNKTLVLEAFNALFNKRDYEAPLHLYQPQACRLLARNGPAEPTSRCPLTGVERKSAVRSPAQASLASAAGARPDHPINGHQTLHRLSRQANIYK
jgi:hypothetical protein